MAGETEALGKCSDCGQVYPVYKNGGEWRVLGTDGSCQCGNREFTVLSAEE